MNRNIAVVQDVDGNNIVFINDVRFKGRQAVDWDEVKTYLKEFVGDFFEIANTNDLIYIGNDFPDEYTGSKYTYSLKGKSAKAKANAVQGLPEMIETATDKSFSENRKGKHEWRAKYGWYKYKTRFALPVYDGEGVLERYNVFKASLLIRHDHNGRLYLYDVLDIK